MVPAVFTDFHKIYNDEEFVDIGPRIMKVIQDQGQKHLKGEFVFIASLNSNTKDHALRPALKKGF